MRINTASASTWLLASASLLVLPLYSCTTTSNLSAVSQSNIEAVNRISQDPQATQATQATQANEAAESSPQAADSIVGAPERDQPAQDRPAQRRPETSRPPVLLTSVPLTSVENRPAGQIMMVRTTAYSHLQADSLPYGRKSAAGTDLKYGSKVRSAAADWSKFPLGTRFRIEGLPYEYIVDDYGSALCGTETLDIYKPNLAGIGNWGARNLPIQIIEWGSFEESARILDSRKHVRHADHVRTMLREIEKKGYSAKPKPGGA